VNWTFALILLGGATSAAADDPKRILLIHSFGRDFAPWNEATKNTRAEIERLSHWPVDIYEASLASARFPEEGLDRPFADYLRALFVSRKLDLVVTIGAPAAAFVRRNRNQIFPSTPVLFSALERRGIPSGELNEMDAVVGIKIDLAAAIENILRTLPETNTIAVVFGNSPIEQYWAKEVRASFQQYADRIKFMWLNELSFEAMLKRVASLPQHSAIFFGLLSVDAAGVTHEQEKAVESLRAVANAPMFSWVDSYLGKGIVGGPLISTIDESREAASVAIRILDGERPSDIKTEPIGFEVPRFDWRELRRWGINEANLPAGSIVEFRVPTVYEQFRWYIIAAIALLAVQAAFIIALLINRARLSRANSQRRRAEQAAHDFSGRLISAQEDERSRLARELHDDVTQRLAALAIDAGKGERRAADATTSKTMTVMREGLTRLSEDIHALSYRLHPSILEDLGLREALKTECERFAAAESVKVDVEVQENFEKLPRDAALGLFRIAQEALRNVARHAKASVVEISLRRLSGGLQLSVRDNGIGFDTAKQGRRPSLGQASMRQRAYLLGGELDFESIPNHGTTVLAWVPLKEEGR
jgi:signal transduction histidine kinase